MSTPTTSSNLKRTPVNPCSWSLNAGYDQAEILEAVLVAADMGLADITRLVIYATDVDEAMKNFDLIGARFGPAEAAPPITLLGVTRLAIPGLMFEIEATAAD